MALQHNIIIPRYDMISQSPVTARMKIWDFVLAWRVKQYWRESSWRVLGCFYTRIFDKLQQNLLLVYGKIEKMDSIVFYFSLINRIFKLNFDSLIINNISVSG